MRYAPVLVLSAVLFGCARTASDAPPVVHYGRDECAHCGMIVSDERYAAALRVEQDGGTRDLVFDDIGDLLDYRRNKGASIHVVRLYVHDFATKQWMDGSKAVFVKSEDVHSPMGSGIIAASDGTGGEALRAKFGGKVLSFSEITATSELAAK